MEATIDPQVTAWDENGKPIQAGAAPSSVTAWDEHGNPIAPAPDTRSWFQKAKDNFNAGTQPVAYTPGESRLDEFKKDIQNFGAGGGNFIRAAAHPINTAESMASQAWDNFKESPATLGGAPMVAQTVRALIDHPAETLGNMGTGAIFTGGLSEAVSPLVSRMPQALALSKQRFMQAAYPENMSLTPEQAMGQSVVKALTPDPAAVPNIKSSVAELPDALAYAQKKGIPQNGKLDTANALRGRAEEIQAHYDDAILKPNNTVQVTVPDNYAGDTVGNNRATLGQIDDRVNAINAELKSNFRKKLPSQTTEANASDADLLAEKGALTDLLHGKLGELTGIDPADIADVRQRAGKLRSLAQEVVDSADKDTLGAGRNEVGGGSNLRNHAAAVLDTVGGGREIVGNRVWKQTLGEIQPAEKPLPQPAPPPPGTPTTPEAAQAEALKAHELQQSAQDAAAQRSQQAQLVKSTSIEQQGYQKILQHLQMEPGVYPRMSNDFLETPEGKIVLRRASFLTPGSPAMRILIQNAEAAR